jgi:hypothetical protein
MKELFPMHAFYIANRDRPGTNTIHNHTTERLALLAISPLLQSPKYIHKGLVCASHQFIDAFIHHSNWQGDPPRTVRPPLVIEAPTQPPPHAPDTSQI